MVPLSPFLPLQAIVGGKLPVYLLMGPDATSISPQAVGVDFFSFLDFRTIVSVTATAHLFSGSPGALPFVV